MDTLIVHMASIQSLRSVAIVQPTCTNSIVRYMCVWELGQEKHYMTMDCRQQFGCNVAAAAHVHDHEMRTYIARPLG